MATPDSADDTQLSDQLIIVADGAKACAKVVQEYHAKTLNSQG